MSSRTRELSSHEINRVCNFEQFRTALEETSRRNVDTSFDARADDRYFEKFKRTLNVIRIRKTREIHPTGENISLAEKLQTIESGSDNSRAAEFSLRLFKASVIDCTKSLEGPRRPLAVTGA